MLTSVKGYFEEGRVVLEEAPPVTQKTEVIVTFLEAEKSSTSKKRKLGLLEGKATTPDDFDEPLEELKDYM